MGKIILTESQLKRLTETGSNSAAMDLDIYVQPVSFDSDNGNMDMEDAIEETISKLAELQSMFKTGKKVNPQYKTKFFGILDDINSNFENIKYQD